MDTVILFNLCLEADTEVLIFMPEERVGTVEGVLHLL